MSATTHTAASYPTVEQLWREGWFERTARKLVRSNPELDWQDIAASAVPTAMRAEASWECRGENTVEGWVKWRTRNEMLKTMTRYWATDRPKVSGVSIYDPTVVGAGDGLANTYLDRHNPSPGVEDVAQFVDWATFSDDIQAAIGSLTYAQQKAALSILLATPMGNARSGSNWRLAKSKLRRHLSHLRWTVKP